MYGDNQEDQDLVRTFKDGKLKPDTFSEQRLQAFPPACSVLMVMLSRCVSPPRTFEKSLTRSANRFHNWVVEELAAINENGRFNKPKANLDEEKAKKAWAKYDNDLFQTGRL